MVLHKTDDDELNEVQVAVALEHTLGATALLADLETREAAYDIIISSSEPIDILVSDHRETEGAIAYVEVKRRFIKHDDYPTVVIAKKKVDRLKSICEERGVEPIFLFWYDDGMYWTEADRIVDAEVGTSVRKKPRASGKWSKSDAGHEAYYFPRNRLRDLGDMKGFLFGN